MVNKKERSYLRVTYLMLKNQKLVSLPLGKE